jgi:uncharacterized protein
VKLLCDEMLHGLARWLRAAGHDTLVAASGMADPELLREAAGEDRILLTRDRHLAALAKAAGVPAFLPRTADLDATAAELRVALALDWRAAPFTRCLVDNTPLVDAESTDAERVPVSSRPLATTLKTCPECRRLYWPGSHFRRMAHRLDIWAGEAGGNPQEQSKTRL